MDCSTPGFPVLHHLPEFAQTHVHGVSDANLSHCYILMKVLEKALAPHSSTLAWKIPWAEQPGRLQSVGSLRVEHG